MRDVVIVEAVRTAIGRRGGLWADIHPADLSAHVLREVARRGGFDPALVDDVVWGCVTQAGEQGGNVARAAVLAAGWPETVPGVTVDRQCGSSQQALHFAAALVASGQADVVVAGGVESMTRVPMTANVTGGPGFPYGPAVFDRYGVEPGPVPFHQGKAAEAIAMQWGLSRRRLDEYALRSHVLAAAATDSGAFATQLAPPVETRTDAIHPAPPTAPADEGIRRDTSTEALARLRTPFRDDGVVTAGNASQISDGAAALLLTTPQRARDLGLEPLARVHTAVVVGDDPVMMLTAPIPATRKALTASGLRLDDIGAFEVNEAFASVVLAWLDETKAKEERLNPLGGAIALGHPLGASGARLATTMIHHMRQSDIQYGLQVMCEGGGTANATILELV